MTKIIPEQKAKQGRSGARVLVILMVALILAMIVWFFTDIYGESIDRTPPSNAAPTETQNPSTQIPAQ